jgi:hypothetical protein
MRKTIALTLALAAAPLAAQEEPGEPAPPPPMPESTPDSSTVSVEDLPIDPELEPQVTITEKEVQTIEEYRAGGQLYMVKITPKHGAPYYLIDNDGDGKLETRRTGLEDPIIPQWVIFRW